MQAENTYPIKWITPAIATCYAPGCQEDLAEIRRQGISVIVNMCAECYDLAEIEERAGFEVYRLFVTDMEAPDIEALEPALAWFDNHLNAGRRGLIHCRYGLGRTGTFALAYFLRQGETLKSAIAKLKATPSRPQSRAQWAFIEQYAEKIDLALKPKPPVENDSGIDIFFKRQLDRLKWFR